PERTYSTTVFLDLSSSDSTKVSVSPSTVAIPAGQTTPSTAVQVTGVATGSAVITAKANNMSLAQATTTVTVGYHLTLSPGTITIPGAGNTATLTLTLSAPAPAGGINFTLTSSSPSTVSVIGSVFLSATSTSIGVRLTGNAIGSAVITASAPDVPAATPNLTG